MSVRTFVLFAIKTKTPKKNETPGKEKNPLPGWLMLFCLSLSRKLEDADYKTGTGQTDEFVPDRFKHFLE